MKHVLPSLTLLALAAASSAQTLSTHLTVDNRFSAYLSTSPTDTGGNAFVTGDDWGQTFSGSTSLTPGVTNYLYVNATNDEGAGGYFMFMGDFALSGGQFSNGGTTLLSNDTDWQVAPLDADGNLEGPFETPTLLGTNGDGPWGYHSDIAAGAEQIWSGADTTGRVLFRTAITPQATPEPSALAAVGLGAIALLRRHKRA